MHLTKNCWSIFGPLILGPKHVKIDAQHSSHYSKMWQYRQCSSKDLDNPAQIKNIFKSWQCFPFTVIRFFHLQHHMKICPSSWLSLEPGSLSCGCNTSQALLALLPIHPKCCHEDCSLFPCLMIMDSYLQQQTQKCLKTFKVPPSIAYLCLSFLICYRAIDPNSASDTSLCYPVKKISKDN